jgi:hypothetical protein
MERDLYGKTLADLMSVHYLGNTAKLQPEELSQKPVDLYGGYVTVPAGTDSSLIQRISDYAPQDGETEADGPAKSGSASKPTGTSTYYFNGWKVGDLYASVHPLNLEFTIPWQVKDSGLFSAEEASSERTTELTKTNEMVWDDISSFVDNVYGRIRVFVDENRNVVILAAGVTAAVLLLLLLIILLRSNRDYRSMKKRRQAEREAERIEAEIEAKTTAEIEQELRAAMEAEYNSDLPDSDEEESSRDE